MDFTYVSTKNTALGLLACGLLAINSAAALADAIALDNYGVYIKQGSSYQAITPYQHARIDFDYLDDFTQVTDAHKNLELIIYQPDRYINSVSYQLRPIALPGKSERIEPTIKKLSDNQVSITFQAGIGKDDILVASVGYNEQYGVVFTDPASVLAKQYSATASTESATTTAWILEKSLKAFPANKELEQLHGYWQGKEQEEKATQKYEFIIGVWNKLDTASTPDEKFSKLKHAKKLLEDYLEKHPEGAEVRDVQKKLATVNSKLAF